MLNNRQGSLYEWLEHEFPSWKKTIGKVVDEESVLYNQNLAPRKVTDGDTLFGIEIDLDELPDKVKSITEWENERSLLDSRLQAILRQRDALQLKEEQDKTKQKNRFTHKIKEQKDRERSAKYQIEQIEQRNRELHVELQELSRKAAEQREQDLAEVKMKINEATLKKQEAEEDERMLKKKFENLEKAKRGELNNAKKIIKEEFEAAKVMLNEEVIRYRTLRQSEIITLKAEERKALETEGVDTERLQQIEKEHDGIEHLLRTIDENRGLLEQYRNYKRDWIDRYPEFKTQLQEALRKKELEEKRYETELAELKIKCDDQDERIRKEENVIRELERNISETDDFHLSKNYELIREIVDEQPTDEECSALINRLQTTFLNESNGINRLTEQSRRLTQRLSPDNRFGFKTNPVNRKDLFELAESLADFQEENKLDMFEKELQEQFGMVLQTYAGEISTLMAKEGEVQRIINDINRDFTVNGGFTTVIKKIELRRVESQSRIIQQLQRIHRFSNEEGMQLGGRNLFNAGQMDSANAEAVKLLVALSTEIDKMKDKIVSLSDAFELQFQIVKMIMILVGWNAWLMLVLMVRMFW